MMTYLIVAIFVPFHLVEETTMPNEVEFRIRHAIESWDVVIAIKPVITYAIMDQQISDSTLMLLTRMLFRRWKMKELRWNYKGSTQGHYINVDDAIVQDDLPIEIAVQRFNDWEFMMLLYAAHLYLLPNKTVDEIARQFEINQMSFEALREKIRKLFDYYPELEGHYLETE